MKKIKKNIKFEKQLKTLIKKNYKLDKLYEFLKVLQNEIELPGKYKVHTLSGNLKGYREAHIDKNIIIIYEVFSDLIVLVEIGTHSDLLRK